MKFLMFLFVCLIFNSTFTFTFISANFVGYLATLSDVENDSIYQMLSKGNDAYTFRPLTKGKKFIPDEIKGGTGGARDPELIVSFDRKDFWIISTDLNSKKVSLNQAQSEGSKSIYIWHSKDLVNWSFEPSLIQIENDQAGMVWTPSGFWYKEKREYIIFWSTFLYSFQDKFHSNLPITPKVIRFSTTKDFISFSKPKTYLQSFEGHDLLHQSIQPIKGGGFIRIIQDQSVGKCFVEISKGGLFSSNWKRSIDFIDQDQPREAPLLFQDNLILDKYHLWLDDAEGTSGTIGYQPFTTENIKNGKFNPAKGPLRPSGMRNGNVIRLTQAEYERLEKLL